MVMLLLLVLVTADECTDKLTEISLQNSINQQNIINHMDMKFNQTSSKFDAQQINFESKIIAMEKRIYEHVDQKIIMETSPLKFEIGSLLAGIASAGTVMALYIATGG
jgi:hypothetical protein